jgi:cell division septum initiation protein DivIVA
MIASAHCQQTVILQALRVMQTTNDWLLDSPSPNEVASASFQIVRRGYDPVEVSAFARAVSAELQRLAAENDDLRQEVEELRVKAAEGFDEGSIAQYLGEETSRLLLAARETSQGIVAKAEAKSNAAIEKAQDEARRIRTEASADATSERRRANDESRQLVSEAAAHRRQMLADLSMRRDAACGQLQELLHGRDVLVQALAHVAGTAGELISRLDSISADPADFPNLDPAVDSYGDVRDNGAVLRVSQGDVGQKGQRGKASGPRPNTPDAPLAEGEAILVL